MTYTRMIGYSVTDARTLRMGTLTGPMRWTRGQLFAATRMTDTGRTRWIRTDALELNWRDAAQARAELSVSARRDTEC
jgi:hypothetical protein